MAIDTTNHCAECEQLARQVEALRTALAEAIGTWHISSGPLGHVDATTVERWKAALAGAPIGEPQRRG